MRVLDDLEIRLESWLLALGRLEYIGVKNCFFMCIRKNLDADERQLGKTIIHELEHYDVIKTLLLMNIPPAPLCSPQTPYPE